MDYTYYMVGIIALIVGFVAGLVFVILKRTSKRRLFATAFALAMLLSGALLINWAHIGDTPPVFILADIVFFSLYSLVGCVIGASPFLLARFAWRKVRGLSQRRS